MHEVEYDVSRHERLLHERGLSRRDLVKLGAALPVALGIARYAAPSPVARAATTENGSPIAKRLPPEWFVNFGSNAEMRWDAVAGLGYTTPNERFFVRDHTGTPIVDAASWSLRVFGTGLRGDPVSFTYAQLQALPQKEIVSAIECAGNGRSFFASQQGTPASGTQWGLGAIGVARWRGVPLSELLERAGITADAVDVMPYGLDQTVVTSGVNYGNVRRPIPRATALENALVALEMNEQPLPADHGFPARLIVPGWIGIANVKWIGQIEVSRQPLLSLWNTQQYVLTGPAYPTTPLVTTQVVKSAWELARGATLSAASPQLLSGRAWSARAGINRVEVSVDRGVTWTTARLLERSGPGNWSRFTYPLPTLSPGAYELWARATDNQLTTQPSTVPFNSAGYLFGAIVRHPITVR
jgi:DMSO/TMAO reductase YedYZ molybdopterin-dependent catalytic subunit